ncbi:MAG: DUF4010 domain-containing protein [Anaerolineales bacterium]|nr:DUF4010 domain-containing protein [Anaerolineales bacterium]
MDQADLFFRFGVAAAIGFLVGVQREFAHGGLGKEIFAGERTLALMGMLGCAAAFIADILNTPWAFLAIFILIGALIGIAYFVSAWRGEMGFTTEVAALIVVLCGALVYWGHTALALAIGVVTILLLSIKLETDILIRHITREDVYATLKFAVISIIILPILPDRGIGPPPFDVLNPYRIWLMVVFISGISFLGYILIKIVGPRQGIGLTGLLGGLASSTAVTMSFSERSNEKPNLAKPFGLAIIIAWTMMFARVLVEVMALNRELLNAVWLPLVVAGVVGLAFSLYLYFAQKSDEQGDVTLENPFELGPALKFGLIYAGILLVSRTAELYFGDAGIYVSSILAGLADVDAITLSMAELSGEGGSLPISTAGTAIILAVMANTIVKGGLVVTTGSRTLRRALVPGFILILLTGLGVSILI